MKVTQIILKSKINIKNTFNNLFLILVVILSSYNFTLSSDYFYIPNTINPVINKLNYNDNLIYLNYIDQNSVNVNDSRYINFVDGTGGQYCGNSPIPVNRDIKFRLYFEEDVATPTLKHNFHWSEFNFNETEFQVLIYLYDMNGNPIGTPPNNERTITFRLNNVANNISDKNKIEVIKLLNISTIPSIPNNTSRIFIAECVQTTSASTIPLDIILRNNFKIEVTNLQAYTVNPVVNPSNSLVPHTIINSALTGGFLTLDGENQSSSLPLNNQNTVRLEWKFNENNICSDEFPNYQIELLRLKNTIVNTSTNLNPLTTYDLNTVVDWDKALKFETGNPNKFIDITITEGTGFYIWRVRAIGNAFTPIVSSYGGKNGFITDPRNYGPWSNINFGPNLNFAQGNTVRITDLTTILNTYPSRKSFFYFNQFDEDLNWQFRRDFSESSSGINFSESMTYMDYLLRPKQTQQSIKSDNSLVVKNYLSDFAGRNVFETLPVPLIVKNTAVDNYNVNYLPNPSPTLLPDNRRVRNIGYLKNLLTNGQNQAYNANNFDIPATTFLQIAPAQTIVSGFTDNNEINRYYSAVSLNSDPYLFNESYVPNANNYPFKRAILSQDASGRIVEQSLFGDQFRITNNQSINRTIKKYYASVADIELTSIFGDQAPKASTVNKEITIDPNKVNTISYIDHNNKVIATAVDLSSTPANLDQLDLTSMPDNYLEMNTNINNSADLEFDNIVNIENGFKIQKRIFANGGSNVSFKFTLDSKRIQVISPNNNGVNSFLSCENYCEFCEYKIEAKSTNVQTNLPNPPNPIIITYSNPLALDSKNENCNEVKTIASNINLSFGVLPIGTHIIEITFKYNNDSYNLNSTTVLNKQIEVNKNRIRDNVNNNLAAFFALSKPSTPTVTIGSLIEKLKTQTPTNEYLLSQYYEDLIGILESKDITFNNNDPNQLKITTGCCGDLFVPKYKCDECDLTINGFDKYLIDNTVNPKLGVGIVQTYHFNGIFFRNGIELFGKYPEASCSTCKKSYLPLIGNYIIDNENTNVIDTLLNNILIDLNSVDGSSNEANLLKLCKIWKNLVANLPNKLVKKTLDPQDNSKFINTVNKDYDLMDDFLQLVQDYKQSLSSATIFSKTIIDNIVIVDNSSITPPIPDVTYYQNMHKYILYNYNGTNSANLPSWAQRPTAYSDFYNKFDCQLVSSEKINVAPPVFNNSNFNTIPFSTRGSGSSAPTQRDFEKAIWGFNRNTSINKQDYFTKEQFDEFNNIFNNNDPRKRMVDKALDNCKTDCESRRNDFRNSVILAYNIKNISVEGQDFYFDNNAIDYTVIGTNVNGNILKNPKGIVFLIDDILTENILEFDLNQDSIINQIDYDTYYSQNSINNTKMVSLQTIECAVDALMNDCKKICYDIRKDDLWDNEDDDISPSTLCTETGINPDNSTIEPNLNKNFLSKAELNKLQLIKSGTYELNVLIGEETCNTSTTLINSNHPSYAYRHNYNRREINSGVHTKGLECWQLDSMNARLSRFLNKLKSDYYIDIDNEEPGFNFANEYNANKKFLAKAIRDSVIQIIKEVSRYYPNWSYILYPLSLFELDYLSDVKKYKIKYYKEANTCCCKFGLFEEDNSPQNNEAYQVMSISNSSGENTSTDCLNNQCLEYKMDPDNDDPIAVVSLCSECEVSLCMNWKDLEIPVEDVPITDYTYKTCQTEYSELIENAIIQFFEKCKNDKIDAFVLEYKTKCQGAIDYTASYKNPMRYGQYTLFYYDRAGNLVQTVPPKGVMVDATYTRLSNPQHTFKTVYKYNSLGNMVAQTSPDMSGADPYIRYIYDNLGRIRFSQTPRQRPTNKFSYTNYDELGRIVETGEFVPTIVNPSPPALPFSNSFEFLSSSAIRNDRTFPPLATLTTNIRSLVVNTVYNTTSSIPPPYYTLGQSNLRNRISYTERTDYPELGSIAQNMNFYSKTIYSYDPHGNVDWVIQDINTLGYLGLPSYVTKYDYEYDLITGNVVKMVYNKNRNDEHHYKYEYDVDNRIKNVLTSRDGELWDNDATYKYYKHGPLKRTEVGEDFIQGTDNVYTINGWLKTINNPFSSNINNDPGLDGNTTLGANGFSRDVYTLGLSYFNNDFQTRTGVPLILQPSNPTSPLFNGNIGSWTQRYDNTSLTNFISTPFNPKILNSFTDNFRYDVLNRIKRSQGSGLDFTSYSYDPNGNITKLERSSNVPTLLQYDNLTYSYPTNNNKLQQINDAAASPNYALDLENQLPFNYSYDGDGNLTSDQAENLTNIQWTADGKVSIVTKINVVEAKLKEKLLVLRANTNIVNVVLPNFTHYIIYKYDAMGRRIAKRNYSPDLDNFLCTGLNQFLISHGIAGLTFGEQRQILKDCGSRETIYNRDANGEVISTVDAGSNGQCDFIFNEFGEWNVYGSEEHGRFAVVKPKVKFEVNNIIPNPLPIPSQYSRIIGDKEYELKDHLGNIRATLSDAKENSTTAVVTSATSYLPFGMVEPLIFRSAGNHRFGFGGMEKDDEWKGDGNSLDFGARIYDPRGARWLSRDPLENKYPEQGTYNSFINSPIVFTDPDGKEIRLANGLTSTQKIKILGTLQKLTNDKLVYKTLKDGTTQIKVASLAKSGNEDKVSGTNLLRELNSSNKIVKIDITKPGNGNSAAPESKKKNGKNDWTKSTNGTGDNAEVFFDPTSNPNIKTLDPKTGIVSGKKRPNEIGLGHELIHAYHIFKGVVDFTPTTHKYKTVDGIFKQTHPKEEFRTVGLKGVKKGDYNENKLRKENKQKPRGAY